MVDAIWNILLELSPWLLGGALIAGLLHVALPENFLRRHLSGRWAVVKAAALGVPMPLCSCSVIPVGLGLRRQGASPGATVAFMIATPQTGADSVTVAAGFLGLPFAVFTLVSTFVLGLVGGWWADAGSDTSAAGEPGETTPIACGDDHDEAGGAVRRTVTYALSLLQSIWVWLAIGIVASAAIEQFIPPGALEKLGAGGGLPAMLLALVIGMPMYVCTTASVPVAAALVHNGFPPGAAMVFLISGPATNVATMGAIYRALGGRTLAKYLTTIAVGSLAFGVLFNLLVDPATAAVAHMHQHHSWWAIACAVAVVALMAWFAVEDVQRWLHKRRAASADERGTPEAVGVRRVEVDVHGMTCGSCVARLERVLGREAGVSGVSVTLQPGRAVVDGNVSEPRVRELVAEAGFHAG